MPIESALRKQLEARGMWDKISELEGYLPKKEKQDAIKKESAKLFSNLLQKQQERREAIVAPIAKAVAPVGESIGGAYALGKIGPFQTESSKEFEKGQEETIKREMDLQNLVLKQMKDPAIPKKNKFKLLTTNLQNNPDLLSQVPEANKTAKQIFGEGAMTALNTLVAGTTAGKLEATGKISKSIVDLSKFIKTLGKGEVAVKGLKGAVEGVEKIPLATRIAGTALRTAKTATEGAAFGAAMALDSGKTSKEDIGKEAALISSISTIAPPVLGATLKSIFKSSGALMNLTNKSVEKVIPKLEKYSQEVKGGSGNFLIDSATQKKASLPQSVAAITAKGLKAATTPLEPALTDRLYHLKKFDEFVENQTGFKISDTLESAYIKARNYAGIEGRYTVAAHDFDKIINKDFQHIKDELLGYIEGTDLLNRAQMGKKVANDKSIKSLEKALLDIEQKVVSKGENVQELEAGLAAYNNYTKTHIMDELVGSGLISKADSEAMLKAHPNWTPHQVLDFAEEAASNTFMRGGSLNVADSGVKGAKGSTRETADVVTSTLYRTQQVKTLAERNRVMNKVFDNVNKLANPEESGFVALRTAEKVKQRKILFEELSSIRNELNVAKKNLNVANKQDRKILSKIDKNIKEIDNLSEEALSRFLKAGDDEAANMIQQLKTKETPTVVKGLTDDTVKKALVIPKSGDSGIVIDSKNFLEFSEFLSKAGINKKVRDKILSETKDGIVQKGRITITSKNVGDTARQAINKLIKKKDPFIERLKNKITSRESKLAGLEEKKAFSEQNLDGLIAQIKRGKESSKSIFEDIKSVRDIKIKGVDAKKAGFERVSYFKDGVKEDWLIPSDLGTALKNLDAPQAGLITKILKKPADWLRAGATRLNPAFSLSNLPRDMQTAVGISKNGFTREQWVKALGEVADFDNPQTRAFYEGGGAFGGLISAEKPSRDILTASKRAPVLNIGTNVAKVVETIGERVENATRKAVYDNAIKNGMPHELAIFESRNATVDFAKQGNVVGVLNQVIPFLNARTQGLVNTATSLKDDPTKFVRRQLFQSAYPAMLLYSNNDKYESFKNIPQFERDQNWIIMYGESDGFDSKGAKIKVPEYVKIRKGEVQAPVANAVEDYLRRSSSEDPRGVKDFLAEQLVNVSPVGISSFGPLATPIELVANYDLFTEGPIEPEYQQLVKGGDSSKRKYIDTALRANKWTGETAKHLSSIGLDKVGLSPARIEFVIGKLTGTAGKDLLRLVDMSQTGWDQTGIADDKATTEQKLARTPLFRTFIGSNASAERIMLYETIEELEKNRTQKIDMQEDLQASMILEHANAAYKASGIEEANKVIAEYAPSKDVQKRMKRIQENLSTGQTVQKQMYDKINSNDVKIDYMIKILNSIPGLENKNKFIKDMDMSKEVSNGLKSAFKLGLLEQPTSD